MIDIYKSSEIRLPTPAQWKNVLENEERRRWLIMQTDALGHAFDKYLIIDDIFGFGGFSQKNKQIFLSRTNRIRAFLFSLPKKLIAVLIRRSDEY